MEDEADQFLTMLKKVTAERDAALLQLGEYKADHKIMEEGLANWAEMYGDTRRKLEDAERLINEMKPVFDAAVALGDLIHMVDDYDDPKDEWARLDKAIKASTSGKRFCEAERFAEDRKCGEPMPCKYHKGPCEGCGKPMHYGEPGGSCGMPWPG